MVRNMALLDEKQSDSSLLPEVIVDEEELSEGSGRGMGTDVPNVDLDKLDKHRFYETGDILRSGELTLLLKADPSTPSLPPVVIKTADVVLDADVDCNGMSKADAHQTYIRCSDEHNMPSGIQSDDRLLERKPNLSAFVSHLPLKKNCTSSEPSDLLEASKSKSADQLPKVHSSLLSSNPSQWSRKPSIESLPPSPGLSDQAAVKGKREVNKSCDNCSQGQIPKRMSLGHFKLKSCLNASTSSSVLCPQARRKKRERHTCIPSDQTLNDCHNGTNPMLIASGNVTSGSHHTSSNAAYTLPPESTSLHFAFKPLPPTPSSARPNQHQSSGQERHTSRGKFHGGGINRLAGRLASFNNATKALTLHDYCRNEPLPLSFRMFGFLTNPVLRPPNYYLHLSIMLLILLPPLLPCFLPATIWAYKSRQCTNMGRLIRAWHYSNLALCCLLIGLIVAGLCLPVVSFASYQYYCAEVKTVNFGIIQHQFKPPPDEDTDTSRFHDQVLNGDLIARQGIKSVINTQASIVTQKTGVLKPTAPESSTQGMDQLEKIVKQRANTKYKAKPDLKNLQKQAGIT